ncbi:MAG: hemerythrin domain-containing protein [Dissulfurispiraceae bacterium]
MNTETLTSRRRFLLFTGSLATGIALAVPPAVLAAAKIEGKEKGCEVNPVEDLMREHGVLRRVLLIYEEAISRIKEKKNLPFEIISDSAGIVRRFIENYHEKLEEDEVFPRLQKAGKLNDLVKVLIVQHQAGRSLTDSILKLSEPETLKAEKAKQDMSPPIQQIYGSRPLFGDAPLLRRKGSHSKQDLSSALQQFIHMYRPHAAMEDTVLFPAFRSIVSPAEFDELGEKFEDKETELFGKQGFEKMVESVGEIEKKLGINDLSTYTPKA